MIARIGKSLRAPRRGHAKRTRAVRSAPDRHSNPPQSPASEAALRTAGAGVRGRPATSLRNIDEVAGLLNVSPRTVRRLIESGALPVHRFGRLVRITDGDLAILLAARRTV
jgi:excisionase family DNA binding protein